MDELLQVGKRGYELTAEEWEKVDELVDKTGCSYYGHLGLNRRLIRTPMRLMSDYLIRISPRIRNYGLTIALRF